MFIVMALAAVAPAPPVAASTENPAIAAFREACVEGSFKLWPSRGRILGKNEHYYFIDFLGWAQSTATQTIVKLTEPADTYLLFTEYKGVQPGSIARTCSLDTKSVSKHDGMAAFLQGLPDKDVQPKWSPLTNDRFWESDHPDLGYRKLFRFRDDGSIVLEIGMYTAAAAQMNAGATKQ